MRTLESLQLAALIVTVLFPVAFGFRLPRGRMAVLLIGSMVAQLVVEGFRWQLVPMEVTTVAMAVVDVLVDERRVRGLRRLRRLIIGGSVLLVAGFLPLALPVPELPRPAGPFDIGTRTFVLVDTDREEQYGLPDPVPDEEPAPDLGEEEDAPPGEPRRLVVQVWYPTEPTDFEPLPWNPDLDIVGPALADRVGLPSFFFSHTEGVQSHTVAGVPPLSGRLPTVIYSHGWTGFRTIALDQIESLASTGMIVIAADHTYGALTTRFPDDGSVVPYDPRALPDEEEVGEDTYADAAEELVETFADDIAAIVDGLAEGTEGPFGAFADSVDLGSLGAYGHSTGGGAAVAFCLEDTRCRAVAGLDAWVVPIPDSLLAEELLVPSMFLRSDEWVDTRNDLRLRGLAERSPSVSYFGAVEGAEHNDFVLTPLFSPIAGRLGLKGPIDSDVVIPLVNDRLVAFFSRELMGLGGALLDGPQPPELDLEIIS